MALSALCLLAGVPASTASWNHPFNSHQHTLAQTTGSANEISREVVDQIQACRLDLSAKVKEMGPNAAANRADVIESICNFIRPTLLIEDPPLKDNVTLKFIHIPKVAGSTIEELGQKYGFGWGRYDKTRLVSHVESPRCWGTQGYHGIPSGVKDPSVRTFCVIRDPYERMVSEIRFELTFRVWRTVQCPSPRMLNELIIEQMKRPLQARIFPCHWIAQYRFIQHCDHVLRMEHLADDLRTLGSHYGTDLQLSGIHSMNDAAKLGDNCEMNTSMFTNETKALLEREYRIDAELVKLLDDKVIGNKDRLALSDKIAELEHLYGQK